MLVSFRMPSIRARLSISARALPRARRRAVLPRGDDPGRPRHAVVAALSYGDGVAEGGAQLPVAEVALDGAPTPAPAFAKLFGERLASIDEVVEMIRETPVSAMSVRVILVRALRARSKRASQALASELPASDPLRGVLGAEGEI